MALSIKNPETERLARELAAEAGESVTTAVTRSLEERLATRRGEQTARAALLQEWVDRSASLRSRWPADLLDVDHGDLLYGEDGLPR